MIRDNHICPDCGSKDVKPDSSSNTTFMIGNISDWECNECGYSGVMPVEEVLDNEKSQDAEKDGKEYEPRQIQYYVSRIIIAAVIFFSFLVIAGLL